MWAGLRPTASPFIVTQRPFRVGPCCDPLPALGSLPPTPSSRQPCRPSRLSSSPLHKPAMWNPLLATWPGGGVWSLGQVHVPALLLPLCDPEHLSCSLSLGSQSQEIGDDNRTYA